MSELQDLEAYETEPVAVETAQQAASIRYARRFRPRRLAMALDGTARRGFYATGNKPSLPKLKCLEAEQ